MHFSMYVLLPKKEAKTSQKARQRVYNFLMDEGFVSEGGIFSGGVGDWFAIGGRFSGDLFMATLNKKKVDAYTKEHLKQYYDWDEDKRKKQEEKALEMFHKHFPKVRLSLPLPCYRDTYFDLGYKDDAMIVTKVIWDNLIKRSLGKEIGDGEAVLSAGEDFCYGETLGKGIKAEEVIGKFWIVTVDYHG